METKKFTSQEFMQRLKERAEKINKEGRTSKMFMPHADMIKKFRERIEKAKTEGKTFKGLPLNREELFAKLREKEILKKDINLEDVNEIETTEVEKKEE